MVKYKRDGTVYDVYPLTRSKNTVGNTVTYDRDTRGKSYFYLRLISQNRFITTDGVLICADGATFITL